MDATGYALKRVVQNQTVVREIDEVRQREMWQWACIGVVLVLVLLVSVWQRSAVTSHGYAVEKLQRARAVEEETARALRLQVETLTAPRRIDAEARTKMHMVDPAPNQAIVIERVTPVERPPSSVVAAR